MTEQEILDMKRFVSKIPTPGIEGLHFIGYPMKECLKHLNKNDLWKILWEIFKEIEMEKKFHLKSLGLGKRGEAYFSEDADLDHKDHFIKEFIKSRKKND